MIRVKPFFLSIMVVYCVALHASWALLIAISPAAVGATPVAAINYVFPTRNTLVLILVIVSLLGLCGLLVSIPWSVLFLLPQQSMLLISAIGAIEAIASSQYADGVIRPMAFIAADQIHVVFASLGHAAAIIGTASNERA